MKTPRNNDDDFYSNSKKEICTGIITGSQKELYQVYHTEGDYNCNYSARSSKDKADFQDNYIKNNSNSDIDIENENIIINDTQVKVAKKVYNTNSNFCKKENAATTNAAVFLLSDKTTAKFCSDKNQRYLKLLKINQALVSNESSFELIRQEVIPKTHRILAATKKSETAKRKNCFLSKSYLEEENKHRNVIHNNNEIHNQIRISKDEERDKTFNLKAENEKKIIAQMHFESNKSNSSLNSEEAFDSDNYSSHKENNIAHENRCFDYLSANKISFNKNSPAFSSNKKKSNANSQQNPDKEVINLNKANQKKQKHKCIYSFEKHEVNYKRIFTNYNVDYNESAADSDDAADHSNNTDDSGSQLNSESFYRNSNNFYDDDFEKQKKKEIKKKILITPTQKLSAIKPLEFRHITNCKK